MHNKNDQANIKRGFIRSMREQFFQEPPIQTTSFAGRTVIITGANAGIGYSACSLLIPLNVSKIILACRSITKGQSAITLLRNEHPTSKVKLQVEELDLSSYASCLAFAERMKQEERIDALVLNAGIWPVEFKRTEGNEESITTNVVSTALLAFLLHPTLLRTAKKTRTNTHITIVSSTLSGEAKFKESQVLEGQIFRTLNDEKKSDLSYEYQVTKLLEVFVVRKMGLLKRIEEGDVGVVVTANAPGFTKSSLQTSKNNAIINWMSDHAARAPEVGARTLVYGASCPPDVHGQYVPDCKVSPVYGMGWGKEGEKLQERVWVELREILEGVKRGVTNL